MRFVRWFSFFVVLLFPVFAFSQAGPDTAGEKAADAAKEKQQKLAAIVEQSLTETQNLRLPENRALFYSKIGTIIWPQNQERARLLFQNSAAELIAAQNLAESKRSSNPNNELLNGGSTRNQILNVIASRDAILAIDLLIKTRPVAVQRALAPESRESGKVSNYSRGSNYIAQNEIYLEQGFYRMAAEQRPEQAVKILRASLAQGLSNDTYNQLNRLAEKDATAAAEIGTQVVDKLLHSDYIDDGQPVYVNIQLTQSILSNYMSRQSDVEQKLRFDDSQIRELAAKYISSYLADKSTAPYIGQSIAAIAERFSPSSLEQIKKVTNRVFPQSTPPELDTAYQKLMANDTPPDQMLAAASKFPTDNRRQIYQSASNKFLGQGDIRSARAVLAENFADDARDQMLMNFDIQSTYTLIGQGKFAEAEQVIDTLPDQQRVQALVNLATTVSGRPQKENNAYAIALLDKARQLTSERPENSAEMNMLSQVINAYSTIDPAEAIRIFEGLVPKINELTEAAAVLNGFQGNSNVRDGEFVMSQGDPFGNYGVNASMIGAFANFDLDRTIKLIDSFTRQETRISLELQVASNGNNIVSLPIRGRTIWVGDR